MFLYDLESWTQTPLASVLRDERADAFAWHLDSLIDVAAREIRQNIESRKSTIELLRGAARCH